ncbi:hypothetical protein C5167_031399 [Papaver somniferum]|uniref:PGG domain-containing protein n=1 Tax=Papaver somniferum TaxID=3469 RepID=A0A4Y7K729_PAPSO|nr:hypothetical protein C5167_031399 [Papaver somniferum]
MGDMEMGVNRELSEAANLISTCGNNGSEGHSDTPQQLEIAVLVGNIELIKAMVERNKNLTQISYGDEEIPIITAVNFSPRNVKKDIVKFLYSVMRGNPDDPSVFSVDPSVFSGDSGCRIICSVIGAGYYDIAVDMISLYPDLALVRQGGHCALEIALIKKMSSEDIEQYFNKYAEDTTNMLEIAITTRTTGNHATARKHFQSRVSQRRVSWVSEKDGSHKGQLRTLAYSSQNQARLRRYKNSTKARIFYSSADPTRASMEVESPLEYITATNEDKWTPQEILDLHHRQPIADAEKWTKDTSQSGTLVSALIVTVAFASTFTIPGGNFSDNSDIHKRGIPIFLHKTAFTVFIVANAMALFSSFSSLLLFLGLQTSQFEDHDYLRFIPKRLIMSFITLFISIVTMMIAFCATLHIILGSRFTWLPTLLSIAASIPVGLFIWSQLSLFFKMVVST